MIGLMRDSALFYCTNSVQDINSVIKIPKVAVVIRWGNLWIGKIT
jgi:hypothetical protein